MWELSLGESRVTLSLSLSLGCQTLTLTSRISVLGSSIREESENWPEMNFLIVCGLFTATTVVQQVQTKHTIAAYNCFAADKIAKYKTQLMCSEEKKAPPVMKNYDIVQRCFTHEIQGHKCNVFRSRFPAMYGVWGHLKLADNSL